MEQEPFPTIEMDHKMKVPWKFLGGVLGVLIIIIAWFLIAGRAPTNFVPGTVVIIPAGTSARDAGTLLVNSHIIRSSSLFQFDMRVVLAHHAVIAGDFEFDHPENVFRIAETITGGLFGKAQVKITIPEGVSVTDIATIIAKQIPSFDTAAFIAQAKPNEGFLFPETYLVFKTITPDAMITRLKSEYTKKLTPFLPAIAASGKSELQIITMASILEKEAKNATDAAIISGILWKRIALKQPLQVDAPFLYTLGKTSGQLTVTDLKTDGPYNTYTRKGLPVGPIGNPGLVMIGAALSPKSSPYFYYLYGNDGVIRYATTYAGQLANIKKYLK